MKKRKRTSFLIQSLTLSFVGILSAGLASGQSGPWGYVRSDGINSVVSLDNNGHVIEHYLLADGWHVGDLSAQAGAPRADWRAVPYVRADKINAVVYSNLTTGHIYELSLSAAGWHYSDLTANAAAPPGHEPVPHVRSDGISSVVFLGIQDEHVYEMYLLSDGWHCGDLTAQTGAPLAWGVPTPYVRSDGTNSIVYIDVNSKIWELYLSNGTWKAGCLTAIAYAPLASGGQPLNPYVRSDGISSVIYQDGNKDIVELYLFYGNWIYDNLTSQANLPRQLYSEINPYVRSDRTNSIVLRGADNHIYELYLQGSWHWADLTSNSGAPTLFQGGHPYVRSNKINSIVFLDNSGHIDDIFLGPSGWLWEDLTMLAGG